MEPKARYQINYYQVGAYGHWLNKVDGELYKGQIVGMVHDQTNGDHRINITLATESGFITIRVF